VPENGVAVGTGVFGVAVGAAAVGVAVAGAGVGVGVTGVDPRPAVGVGVGGVPVTKGVGVAVTGFPSVGVAGGVNVGDVGVNVGVGEKRPFPSGSVGDESQPESQEQKTPAASTRDTTGPRLRFTSTPQPAGLPSTPVTAPSRP
jgi:hypothetical protein